MTQVNSGDTRSTMLAARFFGVVTMANLEWSDALVLEIPQMDDTHREFVDMLALVQAATDEDLVPQWKALVAHTDDHFGREDNWMQQTRFSSSNCHSTQHNVVLQVMKEGTRRAEAGDLKLLRMMAGELAIWFPQHAQSMDAALALHLRSIGFDPETGIVSMPDALPAEEIHGCGGATCSDTSSPAEAAATV